MNQTSVKMKSFTCSLLIFFSFLSYGQSDGKYLLNMSGSFLSSSGNGFDAAISGRGGIFNSGRSVAGGLGIGYRHSRDYMNQNAKTFVVGPFFRAYPYRSSVIGVFLGLSVDIAFYSEGRIDLVSMKSTKRTVTSEALIFSPDIGFNFFMTPKVAIELMAQYRFQSSFDNSNTAPFFFSQLGFSVFL